MTFLYPYAFLLLTFLPLFFKKEVKIEINPKIIFNKNSSKFKNIFLAIAYTFLIIALARPVTDKKEISTSMNLKKVALALDISRSMMAEDIYPNRLTFAKHKITQFIDKFNGEIAILGFSDSTFLISPYTTDKETLKYLLNNINENYITSSGTDLQNLINTAKKMGYKDLVVFTDGGDVKNLDTKGINLYALLIGTKKGAPIKLKNGNLLMKNGKVVIVKRDDKLLKQVKFGVIAQSGDNDIKQLISQNFQKVTDNKKIVVYKELFIYPLWAGLFFISLAFFSIPNLKKLKKVTPIFLLFFAIHSKASILDWHYLNEAKKAYQNGEYQKSAELYQKIDNDKAKFNEADALYKMKKYKEALNVYNQIKDKNLAEKVAYNRGNCYAKMGKIDEAIKSYEEALKLDKNDKDAKYNLDLLKKRKKQQQNSQKNKKNNKNNKNSQNKKNKNEKQNKQNNSQKSQNKKKENKNKKQTEKNKNKENKQQNKIQNSLEKHKRVDKNELKKEKAIKIKMNKNVNQNIYDKIKTQTILYPLSKGKKNDENEW